MLLKSLILIMFYVEEFGGLCGSTEGGSDSAAVQQCAVTFCENLRLVELRGLLSWYCCFVSFIEHEKIF
jgi:hypothetical protein